jgi:hypothetical protein
MNPVSVAREIRSADADWHGQACLEVRIFFFLLLDKINKVGYNWKLKYVCVDVKKNSTGEAIFMLPYYRIGWPHED